MIYCIYPCVGKTTLGKQKKGIVNLDTDYFISIRNINHCDNKKYEWIKLYHDIVLGLESQGLTILAMINNQLLDMFDDDNINYTLIYPSLSLEDEWLNKLKRRADESNNVIDLNTYNNQLKYYSSNICSLQKRVKANIKHIVLEDDNYNLSNLIFNGL